MVPSALMEYRFGWEAMPSCLRTVYECLISLGIVYTTSLWKEEQSTGRHQSRVSTPAFSKGGHCFRRRECHNVYYRDSNILIPKYNDLTVLVLYRYVMSACPITGRPLVSNVGADCDSQSASRQEPPVDLYSRDRSLRNEWTEAPGGG